MNTRYIAAEYRLSHWAKIMQDRIESGQSITAYCKAVGIHENVYYYWQKKLREAACEQLTVVPVEPNKAAIDVSQNTELIATGFTEVKLIPSAPLPAKTISAARPSQIRVEAAGVKISTDSAYPLDNLAALLRELVRP